MVLMLTRLHRIFAVIVSLRVICRIFLVRGEGRLGILGLDDYITVGCIVILLVTCILMSIGSNRGLGRHMGALEPAQRMSALKWNVIINAVLVWSFSLPKFAIIAILKRILDYGTKTAIMFWALALSSQACILATSGSCAPVSVLAALGYFTSAYSAFLDIYFALYPIPFVMRLNMPLKSRLALSTALALSALACIVSIYKLAIFDQVFDILAVDPTFPVPHLDILGVSEGAILLICASLPTLGPLFRLGRGTLTSRDGSRNAPNNSADDAQGHTGDISNGSWTKFKGNKLDDIERESSTGIASSMDDIPLVSLSKQQ
ncbi:hypothetical protein F5884DRAFT_860023 [Xylogone sp. PMI_703]|nr:hypothetical protein F5884DRAFT_860023 [Xylogone sp. PMI_703]